MNLKSIIDVRTPGEFQTGHVPGSINIPLQELPSRLKEIRSMQQPIMLCCASGTRSGQAMHYLRDAGITCENGGSWKELNYKIQPETTIAP